MREWGPPRGADPPATLTRAAFAERCARRAMSSRAMLRVWRAFVRGSGAFAAICAELRTGGSGCNSLCESGLFSFLVPGVSWEAPFFGLLAVSLYSAAFGRPWRCGSPGSAHTKGAAWFFMGRTWRAIAAGSAVDEEVGCWRLDLPGPGACTPGE